MPHVNELTASHEQHDPLLMAALAAGDLAGTEREGALELTRSCSECAGLHDDLVAIARATAQVPPPISMPARDFRLTPERAAALRPAGWRRFFGLAPRGAVTRNVGVALATFGLAGLLIGTLPIGGSTASGPQAAASGAAAADQGRNGAAGGTVPEAAAPAASEAAASMAPAASAAASSAPVAVAPAPAASSADRTNLESLPSASRGNDTQGDFGTNAGPTSEGSGTLGVAGAGAASPVASSPPEEMQQLNGGASASDQPTTTPWSPLVIVSVIAIALGAALFVLGRRRERDPA
jgi:hypothetical protein